MNTLRPTPAGFKDFSIFTARALCRYAILLTLFAAPCTSAQPEALNVERIELDNCVIMMSTALHDEQADVVSDIQSAVNDWHAYNALRAAEPEVDHAEAAARYINAISGLLGLPPDGPALLEEQQKLEEAFDNNVELQLVLAERPTIYVLSLDTISVYVEAGGTLPSVTSNGESFTISINTGYENGEPVPIEGFTLPYQDDWETGGLILQAYLAMAGAREMGEDAHPHLLELANGMSAIRGKMSEMFRFFQVYGSVIRLLDEDVNAALMLRARWRHSGLADYLVLETFRLAGEEDYAQQIAQMWLRDAPADTDRPNPQMLLRYWTARLGSLSTAGDVMEDFNNRRRAYAVAEVQRMIDAVGLEQVIAVARQLGQEQPESIQAVQDTIHEATGYDIAARLDLYEPDVEDVYYDQILAYQRARDAGDRAAALVHAFCALEVQVASYPQVNPAMYQVMRIAAQPFPEAGLWFAIREAFFHLAIADRLDTQQNLASQYLLDATVVALDNNTPELAYDMLEDREQVVWPGDDAVTTAQQAIVDLVEAHRQISVGELDNAHATLDGIERAIGAVIGVNPLQSQKIQEWLMQAHEALAQSRANPPAEVPTATE